jgi:hypothetical protein
MKSVGTYNDVRWASQDPNVYFGLVQRSARLAKVDVWTDAATTVLDVSDEFDRCHFGMSEGGVSVDDGRCVLVCEVTGADELTFIVVDIHGRGEVSRRRFADIGFTGSVGVVIDWAGVSFRGTYVVATWRSDSAFGSSHRVYFAQNMSDHLELDQQGGVGHSDFCIDADDEEVLVGIRKMNSYRLRDGVWTQQVAIGSSSKISGHVSCRNVRRPGYAYIGTRATGCYSLYSVKLDGSKRYEDWGQFRSVGLPYYAEGQCCASPMGDKVVCASDWFIEGNTPYALVLDSETPRPPGSLEPYGTATTTPPASTSMTTSEPATGTPPPPPVPPGDSLWPVVAVPPPASAPSVTFADFREESDPRTVVAVTLEWDSAGLSVRYNVTDDHVVAPQGSQWWREDGAEFFLTSDLGDRHLVVGATGSLRLLDGTNAAVPNSTSTAFATNTSSGYEIHINLSWADLGGDLSVDPWPNARILLAAVDQDLANEYNYFDAIGIVHDGEAYGIASADFWPRLVFASGDGDAPGLSTTTTLSTVTTTTTSGAGDGATAADSSGSFATDDDAAGDQTTLIIALAAGAVALLLSVTFLVVASRRRSRASPRTSSVDLHQVGSGSTSRRRSRPQSTRLTGTSNLQPHPGMTYSTLPPELN